METIICSGPLIIEDNKVLLVREQKSYGVTPWLFPGGKAEPGETDPVEICKREVKEELNIDIEILKKLINTEAMSWLGLDKKYIMHHYLAKRIGEVKPGSDIVEWGWHDINNLPKNCASNVYEIIAYYKNMI